MDVESSESDLTSRVAEGDRAAEAELCRRLVPRIHLYGRRHLGSASAADDLVQLVLIKLIEALRAARLRDRDKLVQFVMGTCRLTVLDLRRTARRQDQLLQRYGADLVPATPPMPRMDDGQLARCIQALTDRERSVVVLTFYDERSAGEAARSLGLSDANVRVIRHRAIKALHACMGGSA